jgi:NAD(P)-dependent dehydrogenase (short-subunit alcohol dehydrogenase family)
VTRTTGVAAVERVAPALVQDLVRQHPMARLATVDEIAATALWLCSADAGFVTGAAVAVDGGFLAA